LNRALAREVVRFLWSSSLPEACDTSRLRPFTRADWQESFEWLHLTGLGLLFWGFLKQARAENVLPAGMGTRLARNEANNRLRVAEMLREFDSINRLFVRSGQSYAVLKGFALVPNYFPDASLRTFTDYDYLLPPGLIEPAGQALRDAGYIRHGQDESDAVTYFRQDEPPRLIADLDEMYSPQLAREVELHGKLWDEEKMGVRLRLPDDFLSRCTLREREDVRFAVLAEEDAFIYHALHTFRHVIEGWCRLSALYEIAYFLKQRGPDAAFWDILHTRLEGRSRLTQVVSAMVSLAARVFNLAAPAAVNSGILGALSPGMALWVDRYGVDSALENFSANKYGLFLYREFVEDGKAWRAVRRRRVFLLKWPSRVTEVSSPTSSDWKAVWRRLSYIVGLLRFHLAGSLRYGFELGRWRGALRGVRQIPRGAAIGRSAD
jgi:Uncharacterised nucleotidyltransferase